MDANNVKVKLKLLLAYDIGEVINLLMQCLGERTSMVNTVILQLARYNDINRDATSGILKYEEVITEMNRLRLSIMKFIDGASPNELDFETIMNTLLQDDRFNTVISQKVKRIEFRGFLEDGVVEFKYLDFNWESYFLDDQTSSLLHIKKLLSALHIIQTKYGKQITFFSSKSEQQLLRAICIEIENISRELGEAFTSEFKVVPPQLNTAEAKSILGYIHLSIKNLLAFNT
ncbi:MAG: hypothetical protein AAF824_07235 [Bacteroidota bacterium]